MSLNVLPFTLVTATLVLAQTPTFAQPLASPMPAASAQTARSTKPSAPTANIAQNQATPASGTRLTEPKSTLASNIVPQDTHSDIANALPVPAVGPNADPAKYLQIAKQDLAAKRTGAAQQALEMAETRLLDRSVPTSEVNQPDRNPVISDVSKALQSLGQNDLAPASKNVDSALSALNVNV